MLSQRGQGRATLARQYLLERTPARAIDAIGHLGGIQSQAPLAPYLGLWTRLQDFAPDELSALTDQRQVVRLHLMRTTVHLVSARDCLDWRALFYPLHAAGFSAHFRRGTEGMDRDALLRQAKRLLEEQPRTRAELGTAGTCARFVVRPTALGDHFWVDAPGALDLGQDRAALDDRVAGVIDEAWGIANPRLPRLGRTPGPRA